MSEAIFSGEVHPAAELFPLMGDDDLAALAADIKANGLRQPIVIDGSGKLLDGRNRLAACTIAKVEPVFVSSNGDDPVALVVSLNVKRRNLSASQRAIAAAEAWDVVALTVQPNRDTPRRKHLSTIFGVGENLVQQARALVERDPAAAAAVKAGRARLDAAYNQLVQSEETRESDERELARLRKRLAEPLTVDIDLLPAPDPEAIASGIDIERKLHAALPPTQPTPPAATRQALREWTTILREANAFAKRVRTNLPALPEDGDADLVAIQATEIVRLLGDAAARIAAALPGHKQPLRRVK